jgi:hypothetical protein
MKKLAIVAVASVLATAAFAQGSTTVIHKEGMDSGTTVRRSVDVDAPSVVEKRKVTTTGTVGCSTKTVQKTDEMGDTKTKQKTKC